MRIKAIKAFYFITFLLLLTSCSRKNNKPKGRDALSPSPNCVFCANAMYENKQDVPKYVLSYCCYEEKYDGDVELYLRCGQTAQINGRDFLIGRDFDDVDYLVDKNDKSVIGRYYDNGISCYLCVSSDGNDVIEYQKKIRPVVCSFAEVLNKYILYTSFLYNAELKIPKELFKKPNGELLLSMYKENVNDDNILVTTIIKYTNDGEYIELIPPKGSFTGIGFWEMNEEDRYKDISIEE